jgi:hypothetical protein
MKNKMTLHNPLFYDSMCLKKQISLKIPTSQQKPFTQKKSKPQQLEFGFLKIGYL